MSISDVGVSVMLNKLRMFAKDESGASLAEYGLLIALIAAVSIGVLTTLGTGISAKFTEVDTAIK